MNTIAEIRVVRLVATIVTALIAFSAYAGVFGLVTGGISFGAAVDTRLPLHSFWLAGLALFAFVGMPMTVAAVATAGNLPRAADLVFGAGLLLVAWMAIELFFIKEYSWFHPAYLTAAIVVLVLGWALLRVAPAEGSVRVPTGLSATHHR